VNGLIRPRIASRPGRSMLDAKGPETPEIHAFSGQKRTFHNADESVDNRLRLQLRQSRPG